MIVGKIHPGSGIGDQLFSYIITRVIALDRGLDFGFAGKEYFKGKDFLDLDWGQKTNATYYVEESTGRLIVDDLVYNRLLEINGLYYDPETNFIEDKTVVDGYGAQDERYFRHRIDEVREWLKTKPLLMDYGTCVINFRGGEFSVFPDLFLPKEYWDKAISLMREKHPKIEFEVHTDDPQLAVQFFPDYKIISGIDLNWRSIRYAKHLIISNSAFAVIPALLGQAHEIIAPRYWARYNTKTWSLPQNYYKKFTYIHHEMDHQPILP